MDSTGTTTGGSGSGSGFMSSLGNNIMFLSNADHQDTNDDNVTATNSCSSTPNDQNGSESPLSFNDFSKNILTPTTSSPKKSSRRSVQKRVVSIPIKEVEGSRLKGETTNVTSTPPSDSWAWRKYGQKPIKGSPYPRGYYRCSSSKGCPARKQVERSRSDPTMLVVTYSAEHNHPWPASSRTNHHNYNVASKNKLVKEEVDDDLNEDDEAPESANPDPEPRPQPEPESVMEPLGFVGEELIGSWYGGDQGHVEAAAASASVLEIPMSFVDGACDSRAAVFPVNMMGEEDESLFADLGELPECSLVFRHRGVGPQVGIC